MSAARLKKIITLTNAYYGRNSLADEVVRMQVADLSDLPIERVIIAFENWRRSGKINRPPLPAEIRGMLTGENEEDKSIEIAAKIVGAVSKFGYTNPTLARENIGEIGWEAMTQMFGSWPALCENLKTNHVVGVQAQLRELCKVLVRKSGRIGQTERLEKKNVYLSGEVKHVVDSSIKKL